MKKNFFTLFVILLLCNVALAQDTVHVRREGRMDDEASCGPEIYASGSSFTDTIPQSLVTGGNNLELRINADCPVKKKSDVFIVSFEIVVDAGAGIKFSSAESSFFTDRQKKLIQKLKPGDSFTIRNIVVHAPDGFKKIDNFKVTLN
ncbi:MAG: hypothetical protein JWP12_3470 [Bacteroidetes bacterium]|nr:hypothetical protein [Bacteroidota bacterium]